MRLVLCGSMLITRKSGVGTGAGASSVHDLVAQQSSVRLKGVAVDVSVLKLSLSAESRQNLQEKTKTCALVPVKVS